MVALASFHHIEYFKADHIKIKHMQLEIRADYEEQLVLYAVAHTTNGLWLGFLLKLNLRFTTLSSHNILLNVVYNLYFNYLFLYIDK